MTYTYQPSQHYMWAQVLVVIICIPLIAVAFVCVAAVLVVAIPTGLLVKLIASISKRHAMW